MYTAENAAVMDVQKAEAGEPVENTESGDSNGIWILVGIGAAVLLAGAAAAILLIKKKQKHADNV
jgi:LPXTG-motif cell wall-anchored protein